MSFNRGRRSVRGVIWICLAGVIALCSNAQTSVGGGSSVLKRHYDLAQGFQSAGKFDDAAQNYRLFIADALAELALETINLDDYTRAAPLFDEALNLAPRSPGLKVRYAQAAFVANDLARTRTLSEGILHDYPNNAKAAAKAHLLLGRTLMKMNQESAARQHFEAAVALDSNFENGYALAVACLDLGDGSGAAKIFSEMVMGLGDTPALHMQIGRAYLNSDFQQSAVPEFRKAVAEDARLPGAHYALGVAYLATGAEGGIEAAKTEFEVELKLSPNDGATHAQLGNIELKQHQYEDAERELNRAVALEPNDPTAPYYLGLLYSETGKNSEAIAAFQRSIRLTKDPATNRYQVQKAHYLLGRLLIQAGQADEARQEMQISSVLLKKSLSKDRDRLAGDFDVTPSTPPVAEATAATPERQAAIAALKSFQQQVTPAIADSYNNLGVIAASSGNPGDALVFFERGYEWNPRLAGLDDNWGLAAFRSGRYAEAVPPLTRALKARATDDVLRSQLAISLFKVKDYPGTLKVLEPMLALADATPLLAYVRKVSLGAVELEQEHLLEAIRDLEAAEKLSPNGIEGHEQLALAYRKSRRGHDADREQTIYESLAKSTAGTASAALP